MEGEGKQRREKNKTIGQLVSVRGHYVESSHVLSSDVVLCRCGTYALATFVQIACPAWPVNKQLPLTLELCAGGHSNSLTRNMCLQGRPDPDNTHTHEHLSHINCRPLQ